MNCKKGQSVREHSNKIVTAINETLQGYPHLKSIIPPCNPQTRFNFDQYRGKIPQARKSEICESTIYEVLLGSRGSKQFSYQLSRLDELLSRYPKYCSETFERQLIDSFFSRFLEIEVYNDLVENGYNPGIDPPIMPGNKESIKADFKINVNGVDIFIELFTPRLPLNEELDFEIKPKAGFYRKLGQNNVFDKIFKEYEHHFKVFEPQFHSPKLIILDKTYSIGLTDIFGSSDMSRIYRNYQFPDYFIGIFDRTHYHIDGILKVLKKPKPCRFYINPQCRDSTLSIPVLSKLFCHLQPDIR